MTFSTTQRWLFRVQEKWLKNGSKYDFFLGKSQTLSHVWVTFPGPWKAIFESSKMSFNSVQTRCIVKGEAQKSPLFWRFSGGFWFSQDRLFSRKSTRKPLNLIQSLIFTNAPCKSTCLYNAPSMHTVESFLGRGSVAQRPFTNLWWYFILQKICM